MKNLSISKKLAISFSTILILFVITIVVSVFLGLHTITTSFEQFFTSPYAVTNTVNNMRRQLQGIQKDMSYIIVDDASNSRLGQMIWKAGQQTLKVQLLRLSRS